VPRPFKGWAGTWRSRSWRWASVIGPAWPGCTWISELTRHCAQAGAR
jgi:hypothetical protein